MANSFEITKYKQQLMSLMINNDNIVELIDNNDVEDVEELIGKSIYNFIRIPNAPEQEETWIALEIDIPKIYLSNKELFKELVITIYIITHERLMPTIYGGTRIDLISAEIDKMLNGYKGIGKKPLELLNNVAQAISVKHRCRVMQFSAMEINNSKCLG